MPVFDDGVAVSARQRVAVLGVPDSERHSAKVAGVVEEAAAEQEAEHVDRNERLDSGVSRERVWHHLVHERQAQSRLRKRGADDADQRHDGSGSTNRRNHARSSNLRHSASHFSNVKLLKVNGKGITLV